MNIDKIREALETGIIEPGLRKAALAELDKAAEPVAWMSEEGGSIVKLDERIKMSDSWKGVYVIPIYTHPPQAAGLTAEEAYDIWRSFHFRRQNDGEQYMDYLEAKNAAYRARLTAAIQAKS